MSRAVALLCALVAVAPASARAEHSTLRQRVASSLAVAAEAWPTACSPVAVAWRPLPYGLSGWAWPGPHPAVCGVVLDPQVRDDSYGWLCTLIAHEVGHLAGAQHTDLPGALMNPALTDVYAPCRKLRRARRDR